MALAVRESTDEIERERGGHHHGRGYVVASSFEERTSITTLRASAPLRFLTPAFARAPKMAAVCLVTFGGGLVDGDRIDVDIRVERAATLLVFTQSSTKVFRGRAEQRISARVEDGGTLILLPDPVAAFAGAHYTQRIDVALASPHAGCVLLDGFTSGRAAFGERWMMGALDLKTTVTRANQALVVDALKLDERSDLHALRSFEAFMTLTAIGSSASPVTRAILSDPISPPNAKADLVVASSVLPRSPKDSAILRIAASSPALALSAVRSRLRNLPEMNAVDPFSSRY